jgi:hypothetical protein
MTDQDTASLASSRPLAASPLPDTLRDLFRHFSCHTTQSSDFLVPMTTYSWHVPAYCSVNVTPCVVSLRYDEANGLEHVCMLHHTADTWQEVRDEVLKRMRTLGLVPPGR